VTNVLANDNNGIRINNDNPIMDSKQFKPATREELLAHDLAITLGDQNGIKFYLVVAKIYPEQLLRSIAAEVRQIPDKDVKKSRGAIFNHLLKKYAGKTNHNFRS
jgi:hypothetical protein